MVQGLGVVAVVEVGAKKSEYPVCTTNGDPADTGTLAELLIIN